MANIIDKNFDHYITLIDDIFSDLHGLTVELNNKKMSETVSNIRGRLHEPFLFVIVGEVKVGKSSFVNALLQTEKDVCRVAPDPCTDVIQQIVYGEEEQTIHINEHLTKLILPIDILQKIAIVDTPGTNTIISHHNEITEKFIPVSDLIVFVFEAKNPYRQSAWQFLDFISNEWRKKVIFVLQQSDLIEPADLEVNKNGVIQYANKYGITNPQVFCVSAKLEQNGLPGSGFDEIRNYIYDSITGKNNLRLKLQSLLNTSKNVMSSIEEGIDTTKQQLDADTEFRVKVNSLLDSAETKTDNQIQNMIDLLIKEYDKVTGDIQRQFEEGLGLFTLLRKSFLSIFNEKEGLKAWIKELVQQLEYALKPALERRMREGVLNIADSVRQMAEIIDAEIRKNKASIKSNNEVFTDIANKRQDKLEKLHSGIEALVTETEEYVSNDMFQKSSALVPGLATGGSIAVIGVILMTVTHGAVFDITGGILSAVGILGAGVVTLTQRGKIISEFAAEIDKGRNKLKEQVAEKLDTYIKEIRTKIDNNFLEFDSFISGQQQKFTHLQNQYNSINQKFFNARKELEL
ncbi:MAG: dynamin family protein [Sphingobacteriales bacterium]|nr:MAG: dynamin family protein [Sphingobacteriales bacterium]